VFDNADSSGKFVEGWIATGAVLNSEVGDHGPSVSVEYRLDSGKLQSDAWDVSTDHSAIFLNRGLCPPMIVATRLAMEDQHRGGKVRLSWWNKESALKGEFLGRRLVQRV
jgi:hypothetical protein